MSGRDRIRMTADEQWAFLAQELTVACATIGPRGWPHVMPLWYVLRDDELWAWTYARSQKVRNLERDPRATLQVEAGERYEELRGVMIEARVELHRDLDVVSALGLELLTRYAGGEHPDGVEAAVAAQAAKRVALRFVPERVASFDHRKLAAGA